VTLEPYRYTARASLGDHVVAESANCLCLVRLGQPPVLYFPVADIDLSALRLAAESGDDDSSSELWQGPGSASPVLTVLITPPADLKLALDHGTFDTEQVLVEVIDRDPDTDDRDVTYKRFPTWGDASHLIDLLDLRQDHELSFTAVAHTDGRRPVVEASQMLGQAIVAASRHSPGRRVVSASMVFLGVADAAKPLSFTLDVLSAGRTFDGLVAQVLQNGKRCAAGTILLGTISPDVVAHSEPPPNVAGPYDSEPFDMGVTGRDLRVVDGAYTSDPDAPAGPPVIDAWVRFRHVPDDPALHAGLLAQFAGHMPIAAALRPHEGIGQSQAHRTLSMGINAISLALHQEIRADEWMLYHHHSTSATGGMTHAECRVHSEDGGLLASFTVDGMVRPFAENGQPRDDRTAL
jgi:acyl-CoA thioesterase II